MAKKGSIFSSWFGKKKNEQAEPNEAPSPSQAPRPADATEDAAQAMAESAARSQGKQQPAPASAPVESKPAASSATQDALAAPQPTSPPQPSQAVSQTSEPRPEPEAPAAVQTPVAKAMESESASVPPVTPATAAKPLSKADSKTAERPGKKGLWARLRDGLKKTSSNIGEGLANIFVGKEIDDELFEDLETQLLMADVGVETTQKIIQELTAHASRKDLKDADRLYERLKEYLGEILAPVSQPLQVQSSDGPMVILMVGVNGVGKTTTIGKLAQQFQRDGKSVMLAAGDTFRAAAVEQLQVWGERNDIPVIAQHTGADSASVIFDAVSAAKARGVDVLIADTAGRLQNKANLMEELKKIVRVMKKVDPNAPHEILLTLDAGTGQNAISQAKLFNQAVGVTGLVMTKLDGTAKGGVIFALADQFSIPIRYIGVGEQLDDLRGFEAKEFIQALFDQK